MMFKPFSQCLGDVDILQALAKGRPWFMHLVRCTEGCGGKKQMRHRWERENGVCVFY